VHPLALTPRCHDACFAQVGKMAGDLWLSLAENFNKVADADFSASHQVEQTQPGGVGQGRKKAGQAVRFGAKVHAFIVYALTNMKAQNTFA